MGKKIIILGNLSEAELERIDHRIRSHGFEIVVAGTDEIPEFSDQNDLPAAYLSFHLYTKTLVMEQFSKLPIGTGEKIPFFQRIESDVPLFAEDLPIAGFFEVPLSDATLMSIIRSIERNEVLLCHHHELSNKITEIRTEMEQMVEIGTALSRENNLRRLLQLILTACRKAVMADAGSIYIRERSGPGGPFANSLLFIVAQNDSITIKKASQKRLPIDTKSIAGYVAETGKPLNIDDVTTINDTLPFSASIQFQNYFGYQTKSMLTVPLKNLDHEVVGVLQLINRKDDFSQKISDTAMFEKHIRSFNLSDESFVLSVAPLAAVSIERAQLHENIKAMFEGFLNSSIASIDERDRVTSGHSRRVMGYAMAFVEAAAEHPEHPFAELAATPERQRQFQFAALLHDIGKIGVPEHLLNKEQKIPKDHMELIMTYIDYIAVRRIIDPESVSWKNTDELENDREFILQLNKRNKIDDTDLKRLHALGKKTFTDLKGNIISFLSENACEALSITKGNLTEAERLIINSHARSSYRILSQIPWTTALSKVPDIAGQHHERIDGTGYPDGIRGEDMFLESKILAVIDIYEALVAQDRPYKPKMPPEKALKILNEEVEAGHIDAEVVKFFIEKNIYKLFLTPEDTH